MKTVSFIIPVYNCKAFLTDCIDSVRSAGISDYEILLIDDGSTDGSGALCDALAQQYPQIRVIHQENGGVSAARNRGIREAQGEKILFLDADDTMDSEALGAVLTDPRCSGVELTIFGMTFDYYYKGKCYRRDPLFYAHDGILTRDEWAAVYSALYENNSLSPLWNKVFRREILVKYNLELNEDMFLYEDLEFVLRYLRYCNQIWNVPQAIYHYRQSEDEGNAKRRLARIDSLSAFMMPIEAAMEQLCCVAPAQKETVLVQLFQVLAREKISVSTRKQIRSICSDYALWYGGRAFTAGEGRFHRQMMGCKAAALMLQDQKTALRHKLAVWAKANHLYKRK